MRFNRGIFRRVSVTMVSEVVGCKRFFAAVVFPSFVVEPLFRLYGQRCVVLSGLVAGGCTCQLLSAARFATPFVCRTGVFCVGNGSSREWRVGSRLRRPDTVDVVRSRLRSRCFSILSVWFRVDFGAGRNRQRSVASALLGFLAWIVALWDGVWLGLPLVCRWFPAILFANWTRLVGDGPLSVSQKVLRLERFLFIDMVCSYVSVRHRRPCRCRAFR